MIEKRPEVQVIPNWELTPARATQLMSANQNRNLRPKYVQMLAREIESGNFQDYSTIKVAWVDGEGEVFIDGQHRAAAVIHTGLPIKVILVKNVDVTDQYVTDMGVRRKLSDILKLQGEKNVNVLASVIAWRWRRENGLYLSDASPTIHEGLELLGKQGGLRIIHPDVMEACKMMHISSGMSLCLYYEMAGIDRDAADDFWRKLRYGDDIAPGDPILQLRNRLLNNALHRVQKLDRYTIAALVIKAWNFYITGQKTEFLKWRRIGAAPEKFPVLVGPDTE